MKKEILFDSGNRGWGVLPTEGRWEQEDDQFVFTSTDGTRWVEKYENETCPLQDGTGTYWLVPAK